MEDYISSDVAVIGAGPVGLFAVFQAGMLGMKSVVIDALEEIGGQCAALYPAKPIYDIPAHPVINGHDLVQQLIKQNAPFEPRYILQHKAVDLEHVEENKEWRITTNKGLTIQAKAVIIATGGGALVPARPPLPGLSHFEGRSVFYAVKDPERFTGKAVCIVGGGDSAVDWAIALAENARIIYLVHRREKFRAMEHGLVALQKLQAAGKVKLVVPYQLSGISGDESAGSLHEVKLSNVKDPQDNQHLPVDALLCFFGLLPDHHIVKNWPITVNDLGIAVKAQSMETNLPGVFAIGDAVDYPGKLKLILTGFAEAALACHNSYKLVKGEVLHFEHSTAKGIPGIKTGA